MATAGAVGVVIVALAPATAVASGAAVRARAASGSSLRIEVAPPPALPAAMGIAADLFPRATIVADALPDGFTTAAPTSAQVQRGETPITDGTHTILLSASIDSGLRPGPVAQLQDTDTPDENGVLISIGRRSRHAPGRVYLHAVALEPHDAAAAAALTSLGGSLDGWWALDPLTTSDAANATVLAALRLAARRTEAMPEWFATYTHHARAGWRRRSAPDFYMGVHKTNGRPTLVTTTFGGVVTWLWRAPRLNWVRPRSASCSTYNPKGQPFPPGNPVQMRKGPLTYALDALGPAPPGALLDNPAVLGGAYDFTAKPPQSLGARGTRYEIYFYPAYFRAHGIFDVGRDGRLHIVKIETQDAAGNVIETARAGIAAHIPAPRTRPSGGTCA